MGVLFLTQVTLWQDRSSETKRASPDPDPDLNASSEAACLAN